MRKHVFRSSANPCQLDHINPKLYQIFRTCQARCQTLSALRGVCILLASWRNEQILPCLDLVHLWMAISQGLSS